MTLKNGWNEAEDGSHVEGIDEKCGSRRTNIISRPFYIWGALNVNVNRTRALLINLQQCSNREFVLLQLKITKMQKKTHAEAVAWSYDMEGPAKKCVDFHCELANEKTEQLYTVSTPFLDVTTSRRSWKQ